RGTLRVVAVRSHVEEEIPGSGLPRGRADGETIGRVLPVGREHEPESADEAERIGRRLPHPEDGDPFLTECRARDEDEVPGDAEAGEYTRETAERDRVR